MSLDSSVRRVVQRAIHKVGTQATIRRIAVGVYDTTSGTVTNTETDFVVRGRLDDVTDRQLSNTVKVGDRWFTVAAADLSFVPVPSDQVLISGEIFTIVSPGGVRQEMAQNQAALYILQLRR